MIGTKRVDTIIEDNPELGGGVRVSRVCSRFLEVSINCQWFSSYDLRKLAADLVKVATILEENK